MKNKILDVVFKLTSLSLVFIAPLIYIWWKYGGSKTELVEVTTNSMPIPILIILSVFVVMLVSYVFSQTLHLIADSPFGYGSIFFFGTLIGAISFISYIWLAKLSDLITYNAGQFVLDLEIYKHSVTIILVYIISGLMIGLVGFIYKKTQ